jgi:valyl-tRNA synthetase
VYRGSYMVNWSPNLQTAVSDLEVDYSDEVGSLFLCRYYLDGSDSGEVRSSTVYPQLPH